MCNDSLVQYFTIYKHSHMKFSFKISLTLKLKYRCMHECVGGGVLVIHDFPGLFNILFKICLW